VSFAAVVDGAVGEEHLDVPAGKDGRAAGPGLPQVGVQVQDVPGAARRLRILKNNEGQSVTEKFEST
jgi:hypothetical protein